MEAMHQSHMDMYLAQRNQPRSQHSALVLLIPGEAGEVRLKHVDEAYKPGPGTADVQMAPPLAVVDNLKKPNSMIMDLATHVNMAPGLNGQELQLHVEHQHQQGEGLARALTESPG